MSCPGQFRFSQDTFTINGARIRRRQQRQFILKGAASADTFTIAGGARRNRDRQRHLVMNLRSRCRNDTFTSTAAFWVVPATLLFVQDKHGRSNDTFIINGNIFVEPAMIRS